MGGASMSANALTIVTAAGSLAKQVTVIEGGVTGTSDPVWPRIVTFETVAIDGPDDLLDVLSAPPNTTRRRAWYAPNPSPTWADARSTTIPRRARRECAPCPCLGRLRHREGAGGRNRPAARARAGRCEGAPLPAAAASRYHRRLADHRKRWQAAGRAASAPVVPVRPAAVWPTGRARGAGRVSNSGWLDPCTLRNEVLPHFIAVKVIGNSPDPCPQRWGIIHGERDRVPVPDYIASAPCLSKLHARQRLDDRGRQPRRAARQLRARARAAPTRGGRSDQGCGRGHQSRRHRRTPSHLPARRSHHHRTVQVLVHPARPAARAAR